MKIFKRREEKIFLSILIAASLSCLAIGVAYSGSLSGEDRTIRDNGSSVFSPGYINAVKQHTDSIIRQTEEKKGFWQSTIEYLQDKLAASTEKDADNMVVPELKKKKSTSGENTAKTAEIAQDTPSIPEMLDSKTMMSNILNEAISKQGSVTMLDNGNVVTIWSEGDKQYFEVSDRLGQMVVEKQFITPLDGMEYSQAGNIRDMGYGKFMIYVWGNNSIYASNSNTCNSIENSRLYDSSTGEMEYSQIASSSYSYRNYETDAYIYDYSTNSLSSPTPLGDGSFAMIVSSENYHYDNTDPTQNSSSRTSSLRILENGSRTFKDYTINEDGASFNGLASLGNGKFVLATGKRDDNYMPANGINFTIMDKDFNEHGSLFITTYSNTGWQYMTNITSLENGKFAVGWNDNSAYGPIADTGSYCGNLRVDVFSMEQGGESGYYLTRQTSHVVGNTSYYQDDGRTYNYDNNYIADMKALDNGSLVLAINSNGGSYRYGYDDSGNYWSSDETWHDNASVKLLDDKGNIRDISIGSMGEDITSRYVTQITTLGDTFGVVLNQGNYYGDGDYTGAITARQFSSDDSYSQPYAPNAISSSSSSNGANTSEDKGKLVNLRLKESDNMTMALETYNSLLLKDTADSISDLKTTLSMNPLAAKEALGQGIDSGIMTAGHLLMRLNTYIMNMDALSSYSIFSDTAAGSYARLMASSALFNMLKNPAEGQENMANTILAIFNDISKKDAEGESILSGEEVDGLIKAIAATILAQAIPDLLTENDLANMKFALLELSMERNRILKDYDSSTKLYYDEMVKEIESNLGILQLNGMISKEMARKDVAKMPRNDIDLLIEKIRKSEKKSAETEHIIQQEAKYRKLYIDPNKKIMEDRIKAMIKNYVNKVNATMGSAAKDVASRKK